MKNSLLLVLPFCCSASFAQSLPANMMPDGSRDTFVGLAVAVVPRYEGAEKGRSALVPIAQVQWSNGIFISDLYTAGMHLSTNPKVEFGPLLQYQPGRKASDVEKISGTADLHAGVNAGGFFNYYLAPDLRLKSSLLRARGDGLRFRLDLQKSFQNISPHHTVALSAGLVWANRQYTQRYFGIQPDLTVGGNQVPTFTATGERSPAYTPSAGIADLHLGANWNWELNADWLLTTGTSFVHLNGKAADSPLVGKRNYMTVHTGLAYRF